MPIVLLLGTELRTEAVLSALDSQDWPAPNHCAAITGRQQSEEMLSLPNMGNSGVGHMSKKHPDNTHSTNVYTVVKYMIYQ